MLVVGEVDDGLLASAVLKAQRKYGSEINYILWSDNDLRRKRREKGAFIKTIVAKPKLWLKGDKHGFSRLLRTTKLKQKIL